LVPRRLDRDREFQDIRTHEANNPIQWKTAEISVDLVCAIDDLIDESKRSGRRLVLLTFALVFLTLVLAGLTAYLVYLAMTRP